MKEMWKEVKSERKRKKERKGRVNEKKTIKQENVNFFTPKMFKSQQKSAQFLPKVFYVKEWKNRKTKRKNINWKTNIYYLVNTTKIG